MMPTDGIESILSGILDLIRSRTGLAIPQSRHVDVEIANRKNMMNAGFVDPAKYLAALRTDQILFDRLISEVAIGETHFFRNQGHFSYIRDVVIPEVRRSRGAGHGLRIWSAGCATGEEPYSLAILLEEEGLDWSPKILATDISRSALASAEEGKYGSWSLRGDGQRLLGRYLRGVKGNYALAARFRKRVHFTYLNLAKDPYPSETHFGLMDLVLCRNVLIYLDEETISDVARRIYNSLADGGFLIIGPSDPPLAEYAPYESIATPGGFVYRKHTHTDRQTVSLPMQTPSYSPDTNYQSFERVEETPASHAVAASIETHHDEPTDTICEAREALALGENTKVIELTSQLTDNVAAVTLCAQALANIGKLEAAVQAATLGVSKHPTSSEMAFLLAVLLMRLNRYSEADRYLRRILYLNRSLAVAQFTLGATLHRLGDIPGASRAYRNARNLAARRPPQEIVPLSDGETAGNLAKAAATQMAILKTLVEVRR